MPNIIVSLNENILRVTHNSKKLGLVANSVKLDSKVANDSTILDAAAFAQETSNLLNQEKIKIKGNSLVFLLEPQDVIYHFVTVNKRDGDVIEQIMGAVKLKDPTIDFNNIYFSHQKVAPFVYQFQAVEKKVIDSILEVSNTLEASLGGIIAWPSCLPKYINTSEACIFVSHEESKQVVILSELNGIYFSGVYAKDKSTIELEKLVHELSIYKRNTPINKIYTLDMVEFSVDPTYELIPIKFEGIDTQQFKGYEPHLMVEAVVQLNPHVMESEVNILNILPLPAVQESKQPLVYVGGGVALLLLLAGIFGFVYFSGRQSGKPSEKSEVLSEQTQNQNVSVTAPAPVVEAPKNDLKRNDLKIRVENGSGVGGVAAKTQGVLQDFGYVVPEIGNADSERATTLLKLKTSKIDYKTLLTQDLKGKFEITIEDGLPETSAYDVLMIVGAK